MLWNCKKCYGVVKMIGNVKMIGKCKTCYEVVKNVRGMQENVIDIKMLRKCKNVSMVP